MTPHELAFSLALQAIDDPDVREVREDAIEEAGLTGMVVEQRMRWLFADFKWNYDVHSAHSTVAALLVLGWQTEMWPVARRCPQRR